MEEDFQLSVIDALGREVYSSDNSSSAHGRFEVDMSSYHSGVYVVRLLSDHIQKSETIIIQ